MAGVTTAAAGVAATAATLLAVLAMARAAGLRGNGWMNERMNE